MGFQRGDESKKYGVENREKLEVERFLKSHSWQNRKPWGYSQEIFRFYHESAEKNDPDSPRLVELDVDLCFAAAAI